MRSFLMHLAAWQVTMKTLPGPHGLAKKLLSEVWALRSNHKQAKILKVSHEVESKPRGKRG
tara:strand:- start:302 stop:484 length:183 start_codon:yes stop_codon:yes gene_type:complete